jgi:cell division protein FtsB
MRLFTTTKNRKREGALLKMLPVTRGLLLCGIIASIGFGYVWQKNSIIKLGDDIRQHEQQLDALHKRNVVLLDQVATLKSPRVIEYKVKSWNLGLAMPKESQIVRVADPMLTPVKTDTPEQRASVSRPTDRQLVASNRNSDKQAMALKEVRND